MLSKKPLSELRMALGELRPYFVRTAWFGMFSGLLALMPSWYMLEVYERVINSRSHLTLVMLTLLVIGAYLLMEVLEWARGEVMQEGGLVLDQKLSTRVFTTIFEANLRRLPGGSTQAMSDLRTVREFLHSPVLLAAMEAPVALVFLALIFAINPVLGWTALTSSLALVLVGWLNERSTQPPLMAANRAAIAAQQYADGTLRNAQVIESMGMVQDIHQRWMSRQQEFLKLQALASQRAGAYQAVSKLLQTTVSSLLLGLSCWLLLKEQLNGGGAMLIVSGILGGRALAPLVQLVSQWRTVVNVRDAWDRLEQLLAALPAKPAGMTLPAPKGALRVENVMANAPNSQALILRGINFALAPGDVLAVVGPSACGKSTLARLLVGLWPAGGGKVRLDGSDVFTWNKAELGPHVGYLPQRVELFDGTLAENIARFGAMDLAKVEAAAKMVGLHEHIMSLPQNYQSPVGVDGAFLSGGQRQRVALARAIFDNPVFVVLDEPNSSLDEAGDAALLRVIAAMKSRGTTFVVMTHRINVCAVADKMLVLREGQVQAFGPRDQVMDELKKASAKPTPGPVPHQGKARTTAANA